MKHRAWLFSCALALGVVAACGGADQNPLLDDSGSPVDSSVPDDATKPQPDGSVVDVVANDGPIIEDVVTVDVPVGPPDSHIQCGPTITCSAQTQICCHHTQSVTQWECVSDQTDCNAFGDVPIGCSSHENCVSQGVANDVCCADSINTGQCNAASSVSCQATCDPQSGQFQVGCSTNDPCAGNQTCKASTCSLVGYNICVAQ